MKLIILDRDGVINYDSDEYIKSAEEWRPIPGSLEAIARLSQNNYRVIVASNQSGLARGKFDIDALNKIHQKMHTHLSQYGGIIEAIFFCPHGPDAGCECRKPKPGLLKDIAERLHISLRGVTSVGDKLSDIEAAQTAGANPVLVKTGHGQSVVDSGDVPDEVPVYDDLATFVDSLFPAE